MCSNIIRYALAHPSISCMKHFRLQIHPHILRITMKKSCFYGDRNVLKSLNIFTKLYASRQGAYNLSKDCYLQIELYECCVIFPGQLIICHCRIKFDVKMRNA